MNNALFWRHLYVSLIFCICFEEIFNNLTIPLGLIKYALIIIIFWKILSVRLNNASVYRPAKAVIFFYLILSVYFVLSFPDFIQRGWDGAKIWKQYFLFPVFVYIFSYSKKICNLETDKLIERFVRFMVIYSVLDIALYFIEIPIWRRFHHSWGRISVGYPTADVVIIAISLVLLWFYPPINYGIKKRNLFGMILIITILAQSSGTGIVLLAIIALFGMAFVLKGNSVKNVSTYIYRRTRYSMTFCLIGISLIIILSIVWLNQSEPELMEAMNYQVENRVTILLEGNESDNVKINTMEERDEEFYEAYIHTCRNDIFHQLFGSGFGVLTQNPNHSSSLFFLESLYHINRIALGWLGTLLFYGFILLKIFSFAIKKKDKHLSFFLYLPIVLIILASSFTSGCILIIGIAGSSSLVIADSIQKNYGI